MQKDNAFFNLNQQALVLAAEALRNDDASLLDQLGLGDIEESTFAKLRSINISALSCTREFRGQLLHVKFDARQLGLFLNMASSKSEEDELINRSIKAGLRQPMLEELKGISRRDYANRRMRMGLPDHSKGRIENLNEEDELIVLQVWRDLKDIEDPLERYLALFDHTQVSLDRAWLVIKEHS